MKRRVLFPRMKGVLVGAVVVGLMLTLVPSIKANPSDTVVSDEGNSLRDIPSAQQVFSLKSDGDEVSACLDWGDLQQSEVPQSYREEVGLFGTGKMEETEEVLVSPDQKTFGFFLDTGLDAAQTTIRDTLQSKQWRWIDSGQNAFATFVKDCGVYRWASVGCSEINGTTSVVITLDGGGDS
ncbi:MAG: hypothetical protein ACLU06_07570 [Eggerthellaceae bacterium]